MIEAFELSLEWTRDLLGAMAVVSVVTVIFVVVAIAELVTMAYLMATIPRSGDGR